MVILNATKQLKLYCMLESTGHLLGFLDMCFLCELPHVVGWNIALERSLSLSLLSPLVWSHLVDVYSIMYNSNDAYNHLFIKPSSYVSDKIISGLIQ